jgi:hypothetical protein
MRNNFWTNKVKLSGRQPQGDWYTNTMSPIIVGRHRLLLACKVIPDALDWSPKGRDVDYDDRVDFYVELILNFRFFLYHFMNRAFMLGLQ